MRPAPAGVALGLLLVAWPQVAPAAPGGRRQRPGAAAGTKGVGTAGEVRYVTSTLAYLNRGSQDGVTVGMSIAFTRGGRGVGTCTVDTAFESWSTCLAAGVLRKGDRFAIGRKAEEAVPGPPVELPAPEALAVQREAVDASAQKLVDFDGDSGGPRARRFSVTLGHATYANLSGEGGPFHVQRLDAAVYDVELYRGLRVSADLSVYNVAYQPTEASLRPLTTPQLVVRQLEVGFRRADIPFAGALGRLWTRYTPGMLVLDGAQASWRAGDWLETGVYGGLLPDAVSLMPGLGQWTAGAFVMARFQSGEGAESTLGQVEARAGYAVRDVVGGRFELGASGHLYQGKKLDAHLQLQLGYGGPAQALAGIDAAQLSVGWRPLETLRFTVGGRYRGETPSGVQELGTVAPGLRSIHGDLGGTWEVKPWLWVAASGGVATDLDAGLLEGNVGPEVTFPTLFGPAGSLAVGYVEQFGWLRAKYGYVQLVFNLFGRVHLLSRTAWFLQVTGGLASNEVGESLNLDVTIFRWLWARASFSGRTQLEYAEPPLRASGVVSIQVGGQY